MAKTPFYRVQIESSGRDITSMIQSFSYEDCLDEDDFVKLSLGKVTNEMIDDNDFIRGKSIVYNYGFSGGKISPKRVASITDIDVMYAGDTTMTLKLLDGGFALKKQTSNKIYKQLSSSDIVKEIARNFGFVTNIEDTTKVHEAMPQGNRTYFDFIKYLVTLETGGTYRFYLKDNILVFNKRDLTKDAVKQFTYFGGRNNVKSFHPKYDQEKDGKSDNVTATGIDPDTGEVVESKSNNDNSQETGLGKTTVSYDVNGSRGDGVVRRDAQSLSGAGNIGKSVAGKHIVHPETKQDDLDNVTKKVKKDGALGELKGTLVVEGSPEIFSDDIITMAGVAKRHQGNWYCKKITHAITNGGYITTMEMNKNASDKALSDENATVDDQNRTVGADEAQKKTEVSDVNYSVDGLRE